VQFVGAFEQAIEIFHVRRRDESGDLDGEDVGAVGVDSADGGHAIEPVDGHALSSPFGLDQDYPSCEHRETLFVPRRRR
jgi:hypothetical protein